MGISTVEKAGLESILSCFSIGDLFDLTFTVTKGLVKPENKNDALQAIFLYSESASLLLRRKKVKKEIIFNYLRGQGIVVSVNGDKRNFIEACLKHWGSENQSLSIVEATDIDMDDQIEIAATPPPNAWVVKAAPDLNELLSMGQSFSQWFYSTLNSVTLHETFDPHHLWPDCVLKWRYDDPVSSNCGRVEADINVAQFLNEVVVSKGLRFEPTLQSVASKFISFGLVQVAVEGIVHRGPNCVGLFQQQFGLIIDGDTWRIKQSEVCFKINCALTM